ncbi:MAG: hypothetical protein HKP61_09200 [Dactylosporangium sp.]|nr:hypothetical protein [Dactylosporangium sp.]NNJ61108.1 hypothetical protein [Dactylosporangium sp.]
MATYLSGGPASEPREVSPDVLRLLADCTSDLIPRQGDMTFAFHRHMVNLAPSVARMTAGGQPMCQRLILNVLQAAQPGPGRATAAAAIQQVGRDNYIEGFPTEQYHSVPHAVLDTVREMFSNTWSTSLSSAWVEYLMWFRAHLQLGADSQRARDAATGVLPTPQGGPGRTGRGQPEPAAWQNVEPAPPPSVIIEDDFDDEDDDEPGYNNLMMSMTLDQKRDRRNR